MLNRFPCESAGDSRRTLSLWGGSSTDARWLRENDASFTDMNLRRPSRRAVVAAVGAIRGGANRSSWPNRAHRRLYRVSRGRDGGLRT